MKVALSTPQVRTIANMLAQHGDTYQVEIKDDLGPNGDAVIVWMRQVGGVDGEGTPVAALVTADGRGGAHRCTRRFTPVRDVIGRLSGSGRAGASDAADCLAAESAKADVANFQRRIMPIADLIRSPGCGRVGVRDAVHGWAAESTKVDFVQL